MQKTLRLESWEKCLTNALSRMCGQQKWAGTSDRSSEWKVTFNVRGKKLTLDIDSGAQSNILLKESAEQFSAIAPIRDSDVIISGESTRVKAYGQISLPCKYRNTEKVITFQVIDSLHSLQLLERKDSLLLGLIGRVNSEYVSVTTEQIKMTMQMSSVKLLDVFLVNTRLRLNDTGTSCPRTRTIPVAIREQVKKELTNFVQCGIFIQSRSQPSEQYGLCQQEKRACPNLHRSI